MRSAPDDYSIWSIEFAHSAVFELPIEEVRKHLPASLHAREARPGVGLLSLTLFRFNESNERFPGVVHELVIGLSVEPDLRLLSEAPNAALFVLGLVSDDPEFTTDGYGVDKFPTLPGERFSFQIDEATLGIRCLDQAGAPVFTLHPTAAPTQYTRSEELHQSFCMHEGELHAASAVFELEKAEQVDRQTPMGVLYPHRVFAGLDIATVDVRACFTRRMSAPGSVGMELYFPARSVKRQLQEAADTLLDSHGESR